MEFPDWYNTIKLRNDDLETFIQYIKSNPDYVIIVEEVYDKVLIGQISSFPKGFWSMRNKHLHSKYDNFRESDAFFIRKLIVSRIFIERNMHSERRDHAEFAHHIRYRKIIEAKVSTPFKTFRESPMMMLMTVMPGKFKVRNFNRVARNTFKPDPLSIRFSLTRQYHLVFIDVVIREILGLYFIPPNLPLLIHDRDDKLINKIIISFNDSPYKMISQVYPDNNFRLCDYKRFPKQFSSEEITSQICTDVKNLFKHLSTYELYGISTQDLDAIGFDQYMRHFGSSAIELMTHVYPNLEPLFFVNRQLNIWKDPDTVREMAFKMAADLEYTNPVLELIPIDLVTYKATNLIAKGKSFGSVLSLFPENWDLVAWRKEYGMTSKSVFYERKIELIKIGEGFIKDLSHPYYIRIREDYIKCMVCNEETHYNRRFEHLRYVHFIVDVISCKFEGCTKLYPTNAIMLDHKKNDHKFTKKCDLCGDLSPSFDGQHEFNDHFRRIHQKIECNIDNNKHPGKFKDKPMYFSTKSRYEEHMDKYHRGLIQPTDKDLSTIPYIKSVKRIVCPLRDEPACNNRVPDFSHKSLIRHLKRKHKISNPYQCNFQNKIRCSEKFTNAMLLDMHKKLYHVLHFGIIHISEYVSNYVIKHRSIPYTNNDEFMKKAYTFFNSPNPRILWKRETGVEINCWYDVVIQTKKYMKLNNIWNPQYDNTFRKYPRR